MRLRAARPRGGLLTSEPGFGHVVGFVVHPLGTVRADVGLGGSVRHRVIADPSGQVDVERAGVDDAVCIHQAPFGQLQNGKKRGPSEWGRGGETHSGLEAEKKAEPHTSI